jgi:hypothetical protein
MAQFSTLTDSQLAEYCGDGCTEYEAGRVRMYATHAGYRDTDDVPDAKWLDFCGWAFCDAIANERA